MTHTFLAATKLLRPRTVLCSTNMLARVKNRAAGHTNTSAVSKSYILSNAKFMYVGVLKTCLVEPPHLILCSSHVQILSHLRASVFVLSPTSRLHYGQFFMDSSAREWSLRSRYSSSINGRHESRPEWTIDLGTYSLPALRYEEFVGITP